MPPSGAPSWRESWPDDAPWARVDVRSWVASHASECSTRIDARGSPRRDGDARPPRCDWGCVMIASRVPRDVLEYAADAIGVRADIRSYSATRHRVKLFPIVRPENWRVTPYRLRHCPVCGQKVRAAKLPPDGARIIGTCGDTAPVERWANYRRWPDERGDTRYQRESVSYSNAGRRVHAVCWHGFRDYFRAVYRYEPRAWFRTSVDTWRGAEDFEARFRESGYHNIGPRIAPVELASACRCPEAGSVHSAGAFTEREHVNDDAPIPGADDALVRPPAATWDDAEGVTDARWAEVNRKFCELFRKPEGQ